MRFENKVVLVSGAASGIGQSSALAFAGEGAHLILVDINECQQTIDLCHSAGAKVTSLQLSVTDEDAPQKMVQAALDTYGRLDVAFNNAGITGVNVDLCEYDDAVWDQVMNVNLRAIFRAMKAQIKVMRKQGGGSIVNTASVASLVAIKLSSAYIASKHALLGLTKAAALDVIDDNIRINAVCPGIIDTALLDNGKKIPGFIDSLNAAVPVGRLGQAEEVARGVLFLASEDASYMIGQGMVIDGGVTIV